MREWSEKLKSAEWRQHDWVRWAGRRRRETFLGAVIILVLTVVGPFGTGADLVWPFRLLYWGFVIVAAGYSVRLISPSLGPALSIVEPPVLRAIVRAGIIAIPITIVIIVVESIFRQFTPLVQWPAIYLGVLVLLASLIMLSGRRTDGPEARPAVVSDPRPATPKPDNSPTADVTANPLNARMPDHLKDKPVLALKAEDHYLRVFTSAGADRILMRLSDAIQALGADRGVHVHRSWWVARDAIADVVRSDGKTELRLTDGTQVPVSRRRLAALSEEGLI